MFQSLIYYLHRDLQNAGIIKKIGYLISLIVIYLGLFTVLYLFFVGNFTEWEEWKESFEWSLKHLIDPGFIDADYGALHLDPSEGKSPKNWMIIPLGVIAITCGLLAFMFVFLSAIQDLSTKVLKKMSHGMLPPHLRDHIIMIGHSSQFLPYFEDPKQLESLMNLKEGQAQYDIAFILINEGGLKDFEEISYERCHFFEITETDLRTNRGDLNAEFASDIFIFESKETDEGMILRFIDCMIDERKKHQLDHKIISHLKLTIEVRSERAERILQSFVDPHMLSEQNITLQFIEVTQLRARSLLIDADYLSCREQAPTLVISGWSSYAAALIRQYRSICLYLTSPQPQILLVYLTDEMRIQMQEGYESSFRAPEEDDYCKRLGIFDIQFISADDFKRPSSSSIPNVIVCGSQDNEVIADALEWAEHPFCTHDKEKNPNPMRIIAQVSGSSPYRYAKAKSLPFTFCETRAELTKHIATLDLLPRLAHEAYLKEVEAQKKRNKDEHGRYLKASHHEWDRLEQRVKNWNRTTADHLQLKLLWLAQKWGLVAPTFKRGGDFKMLSSELEERLNVLIQTFEGAVESSLNEVTNAEGETKKVIDSELYKAQLDASETLKLIEDLAIWEHDRWSAERYINGWEKADTGIKKHSNLVPYDALDEGTKNYDRDNVVKQIKTRISRLKRT